MNEQRAKQLILVTTGATVVITTVGTLNQKGELPSAKVPLGAFIAGVMLEVLAEFEPQIAGGLAVIALITTVFVYGQPAFDALGEITNTKAGPAKPPSGPLVGGMMTPPPGGWPTGPLLPGESVYTGP